MVHKYVPVCIVMEVVVEGSDTKYSWLLFHYRTRKATKLCGSCWSSRGPLRRGCCRGMSCLTTRYLWCSPLRRASLGLRYRAFFSIFFKFCLVLCPGFSIRIRIRIWVYYSEAWIRRSGFGSGSNTKLHVSATLPTTIGQTLPVACMLTCCKLAWLKIYFLFSWKI